MTMTSDGYGTATGGWASLARLGARRTVGGTLVVAVGMLGIALATWHVNDPSWSVATGDEPRNWLGGAGAIVADLAMQLVGLGVLAWLAVPLLWGYALWRNEDSGGWHAWPARVGLWMLGTVLCAAALALLAPPSGWPLPIGMGGALGELSSRPLVALGVERGSWLAIALAAALALAARAPLARAARLVAPDADGESGGALSVLLGTFAHWWLSARASVARVRGEMREARGARAARGAEPHLVEPAAATPNEPVLRPEEPIARIVDEPRADTPLPVEEQGDALSGWQGVPVAAVARDTPMVALGGGATSGEWTEERMRLHGLLPRERGDGARVEPTFSEPSISPTRPAWDDSTVTVAEPDFAWGGSAPQPHAPQPDPSPGHAVSPAGTPVGGADHPAPPRPTVRVPAQSLRVPTVDGSVAPQAAAPFATAPQTPTAEPRAAFARPVTAGPTPQPVATPNAPAARDLSPVPLREAPAGAPETFELPSLEFLKAKGATVQDVSLSPEALRDNAAALESVLADFGVKGQIIDVKPGPVVTLYELEPAPGIKSSRVIGLAEDIARSMSAIAARVAVVPGRNAIGIELPNASREMVLMREIIERPDFRDSSQKLALTLGKDIGGAPVVADLAKMPHLLVAGTTGSGKSVAINTMILSLLYRLSPADCRLIMIDPKMLELSVYDGIPHLLSPVVTDPKKAVVALKWCVREMEERYKKMAKLGVRNIGGYNERVKEAAAKNETLSRTVQTGFDRSTGEAVYETEELNFEPMPFIVVIIDEMADLMMVAGKDIEGAVQRLAQMARAAGIHVIMATQRPSVDVITGTIKANFPTRISFQVTSKIDSRTILGEMGAEQLLGMGDMLYMAAGGRTKRVHGPFVSDGEVESIVAYLKTQGVPDYLDDILTDEDEEEPEEDDTPVADNGDATSLKRSDDPYDQAVALVLRDGKASTSYVQRRLGIGYNRAATLIERMELEGVISAPNSAGKREVLLQAAPDELEAMAGEE